MKPQYQFSSGKVKATISLALACVSASVWAGPRLPGTPMPVCTVVSAADRPWAKEFAEGLSTHDRLFQHILTAYGRPHKCATRGQSRFEDQTFGDLRYEWRDGLVFEAQQMPPESSVVSLRHAKGLANQEKMVDFMRQYAKSQGIPISFDSPARRANGTGSITVFESVEPGVNASLSLEHDAGGKLVGIVLRLAL
jgi:hypothetical protein